jgi:hypothetical protein
MWSSIFDKQYRSNRILCLCVQIEEGKSFHITNVWKVMEIFLTSLWTNTYANAKKIDCEKEWTNKRMENIESNCHPILSFSTLSAFFLPPMDNFCPSHSYSHSNFPTKHRFFLFFASDLSLSVFSFALYFHLVTIRLRKVCLVYKNRQFNAGDIRNWGRDLIYLRIKRWIRCSVLCLIY